VRGWLTETWVVLCHSTRTQVALALGVLCFVGTLVMGELLVGGLELQGPLAPLTDVVRDKLLHRYDKAAWVTLFGFIVAAVKAHRKDRRRLLGI